jgi:ketosteroid isomerase-like protein
MNFKIKVPVFIGITALLLSACSSSKTETKPVDMEKLKTEIQGMEDAFAAAEKAKDATAVAAYYAEDAISYSRNKAPEVGKAAIKASIEKNIKEDTTGNQSVYKVVDLFAEGNMVVEIGSWTSMNSAGARLDSGHFMSYFQNRDGKYLCVRDMNVSSTPAKPAAKPVQ